MLTKIWCCCINKVIFIHPFFLRGLALRKLQEGMLSAKKLRVNRSQTFDLLISSQLSSPLDHRHSPTIVPFYKTGRFQFFKWILVLPWRTWLLCELGQWTNNWWFANVSVTLLYLSFLDMSVDHKYQMSNVTMSKELHNLNSFCKTGISPNETRWVAWISFIIQLMIETWKRNYLYKSVKLINN